MKVTLTPSGLSAFLLADGSKAALAAANWSQGAGGVIVKGLEFQQQRTLQTQALFRAAFPFVAARYNWDENFSFTVQRTFSTPDLCTQFVVYHRNTVPASGEIMVQNTGTGSVSLYNPSVFVSGVRCVSHLDLSCDFEYSLKANAAWQANP